MYRYDQYDHQIVKERIAQFRDQVRRRLNDELTEEEFLPLRLQNGLYMQRHAYMLRIAVPYGLLSSRQLRMLAHIARKYDRGYGHFTTRQNIQFNWIKLEDVPDILDRPGLGGNAFDPDLRQLHPQHHLRRIRRRRRRRNRRSAPVCRNPAPVEHLPSGIRLSAAQVQDRHQRRRAKTAPPSPCTTSA